MSSRFASRGSLPLRVALGTLALVVAIHLSVGLVYVEHERINIDEGWYLYAAKLVHSGMRPYLDFSYVQPPLLPYFYAAWNGYRDLRAGRLVSLALSVCSLILLILVAWRWEGPVAALTSGALLGLNTFVLSLFCIVKAYALVSTLLLLALLWLVWAPEKWWSHVLAAGALVGAIGTRNTFLVAWAVWVIYTLLTRPRRPDLWGPALGVGLVGLGLLFGPFWLADPTAVRFNLWEHHRGQLGGGAMVRLFQVLANLSFLSKANAPLLGLLLAGGGTLLVLRPTCSAWRQPSLYLLVLLLLVGVGAAHFISAHPYAEYQAPLVPLAALLAGVSMGRLHRCLNESLAQRLVIWTALALAGAVPLLSLPTTLANVVGVKEQGAASLGTLRPLATFVQQHTQPTDEIFTFQTYLAVEAQRRVCPGLEMAAFSYYGPKSLSGRHLSTAECHRLHVVNDAIVRDWFARRRPALVVLSEGDVTLLGGTTEGDQVQARGEILPLLLAGYRLVKVFPRVGQFAERMYVFERL